MKRLLFVVLVFHTEVYALQFSWVGICAFLNPFKTYLRPSGLKVRATRNIETGEAFDQDSWSSIKEDLDDLMRITDDSQLEPGKFYDITNRMDSLCREMINRVNDRAILTSSVDTQVEDMKVNYEDLQRKVAQAIANTNSGKVKAFFRGVAGTDDWQETQGFLKEKDIVGQIAEIRRRSDRNHLHAAHQVQMVIGVMCILTALKYFGKEALAYIEHKIQDYKPSVPKPSLNFVRPAQQSSSKREK